MDDASDFLAKVTMNHNALLYRCRWSEADAEQIVPKLIQILSHDDPSLVEQALRGLFLIGTPAVDAAPHVALLISSSVPITKRLAVLTLGQIAHTKPHLCVDPVATALDDDYCCRDALRILAFIGEDAKHVLPKVIEVYKNRDARTRKAVVTTVASIDKGCNKVTQLLNRATEDKSKIVRVAAEEAIKNVVSS